ncbi:hypothetical protein [Streptomyces avidinii]|uniref:Uncharacterized protein n=1 Tax=Streptomyces avidinii TaxID=1895 RepID=A0ABS4L4Q6_STRAV|nr:hypothetical protein [Streptomyces avidinii]MBP2037085.1 hypothetical protein [Streptomyces avidinii]GGY95082.1 hypothetical protein GCM10010343_20640 [Streptomyces avidinii]
MQLRRAVPLSLVVLLASTGCVSVGPQDTASSPARGAVPPAEAPETPTPLALPLGPLPPAATPGPDASPGPKPATGSDPEPEPARGRAPAKAAPPPRRGRVPGPAPAHPRRRPAPPPRMDQLCAAAEGTVPPSIVDLCLRQYGR